MKTIIYIFTFILGSSFLKGAAPPNDACNSAINLTTGSSLCGQNASGVTLEAYECYIDFAGSTEGSMWYSFNATSSSMVLSFLQTNLTNCAPYYIVYGPYSSVSAGCSIITDPFTPCSANGGTVLANATPTLYVSNLGGMYYNLLNGDPGNNLLLTGLNTTPGNNTYLIQMVNNNCGGGNQDGRHFV